MDGHFQQVERLWSSSQEERVNYLFHASYLLGCGLLLLGWGVTLQLGGGPAPGCQAIPQAPNRHHSQTALLLYTIIEGPLLTAAAAAAK